MQPKIPHTFSLNQMDPKKCKKMTSHQNMMRFDGMKWTNKNVPKHCQMAKMENNQYISPSDY
jgi:hypothetical protein